MKKIISVLLCLFSLVILNSCMLAKEYEEADLPGNLIPKEELIIGYVFDLLIEDVDLPENYHDEFLKVYVADFSDDGKRMIDLYSNKGIVNLQVNYNEVVEDEKTYITNKVYGEIIVNKPTTIYRDGIVLDDDGNIKIKELNEVGHHVNTATVTLTSKFWSKTDLLELTYEYEFKYVYTENSLEKVIIQEFDKDDNLIKEFVITEDREYEYELDIDTEYLIVYEENLNNEKQDLKLFNVRDLENRHYYPLHFFNKYGFVEGNQLIFIKK